MLNINSQKLKFQPLYYSYPKIGISHVEAADETGVDYGVSFAELGHVLEYHLATARQMASHPSVHSEQKALSAFGRSFPRLIQKSLKSSSPLIQVNLK